MNEPVDLRKYLSYIRHPDNDLVPFLTPDQIDLFIDWAWERFDLQSFYQSNIRFKREQIAKFLKECSTKLETNNN